MTKRKLFVALAGVALMVGTAGAGAQTVPLCDDVTEGMCRSSIIEMGTGLGGPHWWYIVLSFHMHQVWWSDSEHNKCSGGLVTGPLRLGGIGLFDRMVGMTRRGRWHGRVRYRFDGESNERQALYVNGEKQ